MYTSIAMEHIAANMSVTGFGSLSVSCWFVRIYLFKFVAQWVHCDVSNIPKKELHVLG